MARVGRRIIALLAVTGAAVLLAQPIWAAASEEGGGSGSGTFAETSFVVPPTFTLTADGSTLFSDSTSGTFSGTISGTFTEVISGVVFADGNQTFSGVDVCVCSVAGHAGTFVDRFQGAGLVPNFTGTLTVVRGTGSLRNLHATVKFTGSVGVSGFASGEYSVRYRFRS